MSALPALQRALEAGDARPKRPARQDDHRLRVDLTLQGANRRLAEVRAVWDAFYGHRNGAGDDDKRLNPRP